MWKIEHISVLFQELEKIARDCGYFVNLGGSVLFKSYSEHDLDIVLCKYVENPNEDAFIHNVITFLDGHMCCPKYEGMFANAYVIEIIEHGQSHLIDISIRK